MNSAVQKTVTKIASLEIQGATQITRVILDALQSESNQLLKKTKTQFLSEIRKSGKALAEARPTEPLSRNSVQFVLHYLENNKDGLSVPELVKLLKKACHLFLVLLKYHDQKIAEAGARLIKPNMKVFTHCHSSTVEHIIAEASKHSKMPRVFCTETRPLFQGRTTAKNLLKQKIDVTMVADSAAAFLISRTSGREVMVDIAFLGADSVTSGGSVINKVGSFGIALVANHEKIPVYVAASLLKTDPETFISKYIGIELRDRKEIWPNGPKGLKIINFAFDRIPFKFIKGIICEFGVIKPRDVAYLVQKHYPWIFKNF
ncbi:MAG: translation initiation factor eIF-2B [Patescibacteria group bacterium]